MRYMQGVQSMIEAPFKKKFFFYGLICCLLFLLKSHLASAFPLSNISHGSASTSTASAASGFASKTGLIIPIATPVDYLARRLTTSTVTIEDRPAVTVVVMDVNIANAGGILVPEVNSVPISSIFVSPIGPSPSVAPGLDVVFSSGPNAAAFRLSTTTLVMLSPTTAAGAAAPSITAAAIVTSTPTPRKGHIIFESVTLAALMILTGMLTSRVITIYPHRHKLFESGVQGLRWIALAIPVLGLFFVISCMVLINIWDDNTPSRCRAAVEMCLTFYFGVKVFEYLFMIERAHQLRRTRFITHIDDFWFLGEVAGLIIGFGVIAFFAYSQPDTHISSIDGLCRIGLPPAVAIAVLVFDVVLNFVLAIHYCIIAWKLSPISSVREAVKYIHAALPFTGLKAFTIDEKALRKFQTARVMLGLVAITIPTIANLASLVYVHGYEQGWLCYTACTLDITWGVIVIHWLTSKPSYSVPTVRRWPG